MLSGKVSKICISLPPEAMAQLDYLVKVWRMPPTVKRSQVIQQAIWQAYTFALAVADSDDYFLNLRPQASK